MLSCCECGGTFQRAGSRGPIPKWCPPCKRARQNVQYRTYKGTLHRACKDCGKAVEKRRHVCDVCLIERERRRWGYSLLTECRGCGDQLPRRAIWCGPCGRLQRRVREAQRRAVRNGSPLGAFAAREVFDRDGWICGLCLEPVNPSLGWPDPLSASIDHVVPLSLGGPHALTNVQTAHLRCNVAKGNRVEVLAK